MPSPKSERIILLGSTGVGKTNLLNSLQKFPPAAISYVNRTKYASDHDLKLSKRKFTLVDTPGDLGYAASREKTLRDNLRHGKIGIINVVCYGYHEYGADPQSALNTDDSAKEEAVFTLTKQARFANIFPLRGSYFDACGTRQPSPSG